MPKPVLSEDDPPIARTKPGPRCLVWGILRDLDARKDGSGDTLRKWLDDLTRYSHESLAEKLGSIGYPISGSTLGRHRSRRCSCPKV